MLPITKVRRMTVQRALAIIALYALAALVFCRLARTFARV